MFDLKTWIRKSRATKFCSVAPNISGFSEWDMHLQLRILKWLPDVLKVGAPLVHHWFKGTQEL
jgi:hypothetical protein